MIRTLSEGFLWSGSSDRKIFLYAVGTSFALITALRVALSASGPFGLAPTILFPVLGLLIYPLVGVTVRRLHGLGLSGGWASLLFVPFIGLGLVIVLLVLPEQNRPYRPGPVILARFGQLFTLSAAILVISRVWWAPFWIPTASMKPNLIPGDYVAATRVTGGPERGRIYVFHTMDRTEVFAKRLIGLPGEKITIEGGILAVDGIPSTVTDMGDHIETYEPAGPARELPQCVNMGVALGTDCMKRLQKETLPDGTSHLMLDIRDVTLDHDAVHEVPEWGLFFLGDNRDNSLDSRLPARVGGFGYVPVENVIARVDLVILSARGASLLAFWNWRPDRFWSRVE